jgi:hypothetical protein
VVLLPTGWARKLVDESEAAGPEYRINRDPVGDQLIEVLGSKRGCSDQPSRQNVVASAQRPPGGQPLPLLIGHYFALSTAGRNAQGQVASPAV